MNFSEASQCKNNIGPDVFGYGFKDLKFWLKYLNAVGVDRARELLGCTWSEDIKEGE